MYCTYILHVYIARIYCMYILHIKKASITKDYCSLPILAHFPIFTNRRTIKFLLFVVIDEPLLFFCMKRIIMCYDTLLFLVIQININININMLYLDMLYLRYNFSHLAIFTSCHQRISQETSLASVF